MACGVGLYFVRTPAWPQEHDAAEQTHEAELRSSRFQIVVRYVNNALVIAIGGLITLTAFVRHGSAWMLLWTVILLLLMVCIVLAVIDALSSLSSYRKALPQAARRSLGSDHDVS